MFSTLLIIGALSILGVHSQDTCQPKAAENLTLSNGILTWAPAADEECTPTNYIVYILASGELVETYDVTTPTLDVSSLDICRLYYFSVTAVSNHVLGNETHLQAQITPPNVPYEILTLNVTQDDYSVILDWSVEERIQHCFIIYRLVIWDEDDTIPHDVYVIGNSYNISNRINLVPCMYYEFGLRAILTQAVEGPESLVPFTAPAVVQTPPRLARIAVGTNVIDTYWNFQTYQANRCQISGLNIDAVGFFNTTFPVQDTPERQPFNVRLVDLEPNTVYLSYVTTINSAGPSDTLTIALQTNP